MTFMARLNKSLNHISAEERREREAIYKNVDHVCQTVKKVVRSRKEEQADPAAPLRVELILFCPFQCAFHVAKGDLRQGLLGRFLRTDTATVRNRFWREEKLIGEELAQSGIRASRWKFGEAWFADEDGYPCGHYALLPESKVQFTEYAVDLHEPYTIEVVINDGLGTPRREYKYYQNHQEIKLPEREETACLMMRITYDENYIQRPTG